MTATTQTAENIDNEVDAVMTASRILIGVVAQSLAEVDGVVSLLQFRTLVIVASAGQPNLREVADRLGVHPSNATRIVDKLVALRLVTRGEAPHDRRYATLALTARGRRLVDRVMTHRRDAIQAVMVDMKPALRRTLAVGLEAFSQAAGSVGAPADEFVLQLPT